MLASNIPMSRNELSRPESIRQRTILCATLGMSRSDVAVIRASAIAKDLGADLVLLYVSDSRHELRTARRRSALASNILDALARELERSGLRVTISVRSGLPTDAIADAAHEFDADLIVLGPYRRRFADSLRGTRAEVIAHKAERPVLVANRKVKGRYRHVLLTSDLSGMTAGIARVTKKLGLLKQSRASIVHALEHSRRAMLYMVGANDADSIVRERSLRGLACDEIRELISRAGLDANCLPVFSPQVSPLVAIEQTASLVDSDLVVVGCSRFPGLKRLMATSVSNQVLQRSDRDVLLISPAAARRVRQRAVAATTIQQQGSESTEQTLQVH